MGEDASGSIEQELGLDPAALLAKYREERDRRLRPDKGAQYLDIAGDFAHYRDDPWADAGFTRAPFDDEVDVAIVGGGLGGLLVGAHLRKAGVEDIRIIERGGDFGGVWYWNRYPGAACDTQAVLYMPMLEELGVMPTSKFASGAELRAHWQLIARTFGLYRNACLQTEVEGLRWDEAAGRWIISTNRGDAIRARYVTIAVGPMERPKLPGIPGIADFKGHSFHTSRWDYAYSGGDPDGDLTGLADKRVGMIGTGSTAIQAVPHLAASAKHLTVFQRTPSSVDIRANMAIDTALIERLGPGWQAKLRDNFTALVSGIYDEEDLIGDGWTSVMANIRNLLARKRARGEAVDNPMTLHQLADYMKMEAIRARVDAEVADPDVAALLKPWYNRFCKRPCFHDDYLAAFNRPNVTLVDASHARGVERITENAVVVAGKEYPVDCLIFSTGFDVGTPFARRIGYDVVGCGGTTLVEKWAEGAATQHGVTVNGFPNLFIMSVVQSGVSLNFTHMIDEQAKHIAYILGRADREHIDRIEVTAQAERDWCAEIDRNAVSQLAFQSECTPSYFNFEGDLTRFNVRNSQYGGGPIAFYDIIRRWREAGDLAGLDIRARPAAR